MTDRAGFRIVDGPLRGLIVIVPRTAVGKPIRLSDLGHRHLTSAHRGHYLPILETGDGIDGRVLRWVGPPDRPSRDGAEWPTWFDSAE
ncbi:MAG: hypothetical protein AB7R55_00235 [Gemmatimonadales bacterium]